MSQEKTDFPKFNCICELCDCGKHKQHKGCSKRRAEVKISWGSDSCQLSHYRSTFTWPQKRRQWSSKKRQRSLGQLALPQVHQLGSHHLTSPPPRPTPGPDYKPMQTCSLQSLATPPKESETCMPGTRRPASNALRHDIAKSSFQNHKRAPYSQSLPRLGELPAVIGSLLYPDQREKMETTTNCEFPPKMGCRPKRAQVVQCNLTLEGERDLETTHREQFKPYPIEGAPVVRRRREPMKERVLKEEPMESLTRYSSDFAPWQCAPERRNPVWPHPDNLTINPALRNEFRTVQMETYPGWDPSKHRRPAPARLREELSVKDSDGHFQGDSVTKLAFQPLPLPSPRHKPKPLMPTLKPMQGPFDDRTANKEFFKDWGVHRRVRYGDPYDGVYMRPLGKFESETTNSRTFFQKKAERVKNYKPQDKLQEDKGQLEFATEQREAYRPLSLPVCQLQLYLAQNLPANQGHLSPPVVQT